MGLSCGLHQAQRKEWLPLQRTLAQPWSALAHALALPDMQRLDQTCINKPLCFRHMSMSCRHIQRCTAKDPMPCSCLFPNTASLVTQANPDVTTNKTCSSSGPRARHRARIVRRGIAIRCGVARA